jgi:hypothetical protein
LALNETVNSQEAYGVINLILATVLPLPGLFY